VGCYCEGYEVLTAEGVVGKIVIFLVERGVRRLGALSGDRRRKACRSLTKLYFCVQYLDEVTEEFIKTFSDFAASGDAIAVMNALSNHGRQIEFATNNFIDLGTELQGGLEILDPALASCCHALFVGKYDFLSFMSNAIVVDRSTAPPSYLIKVPEGRLELVDMSGMYESAEKAMQAGEKFYWPVSAFDDFEGDFFDMTIGRDNRDVATKLMEMITCQNKILKDARERLRNLIAQRFSVEEVLFQSDSHPHRKV
jgi:hypothetical protein